MFATLQTRPRLLTAAAFAVTFAILAGHPTLARSVGADVWNVPELNEQLREATGENTRLRAESDTVLNRIAVKESVVQELILGRTTLAEATDRFAEMNATRPQALEAVRSAHPGATDREKTARNVITFALGRVPAEDHSALAGRLDGELQRLIADSSAH